MDELPQPFMQIKSLDAHTYHAPGDDEINALHQKYHISYFYKNIKMQTLLYVDGGIIDGGIINQGKKKKKHLYGDPFLRIYPSGVPWWLRGLRIQHRPCSGVRSVPGPGTSTCLASGQKRKKKEEEKEKERKYAPIQHFYL